jgi:hypothetical protein
MGEGELAGMRKVDFSTLVVVASSFRRRSRELSKRFAAKGVALNSEPRLTHTKVRKSELSVLDCGL